jgi:hypothetical protein
MAEAADDDATRTPFPASAAKNNGTMYRNIYLDHEPLERLAPRITSARAINAVQQLKNSNLIANFGGQHLHHRSLSEGSITDYYHQHGRTASRRFMEENEGEAFQTLPPYTGSEMNPVNTRPASPELHHDEPEPRRTQTMTSISFPERQSSRPTKESNGNSRDARHQDVEDGAARPRHVPRANEIEAARRVLAEAEKIGYHVPRKPYKQSSAHTGRATPPPIGRGRIYIKDDFEDMYESAGNGPPSPEAVSTIQEEPDRGPLSRNYSQTSTSTHQSQPLRRSRSQHEEPRSPVLTHLQLSDGSTLVPGRPRHAERPRSYDGASDVFDEGFDGVNRTFLRSGTSVANTEDRAFLRNTSVAGDLEDRNYQRNGSMAANTEYRELQRNAAVAAADYRPITSHRSTFSDETHTMTRRTITGGGQSIRSNESSSRLPDFFSYSIFQTVLRNPTTAHQLLKFSEIRLCSENIEFLSKVSCQF